jgi:cytochrome c peroxidase
MHDGSIATLSEVIDIYAAGGRNVLDGPYQGDGRLNPLKSPFVKGFKLSVVEKQQLLSFLDSLTDTHFTQDPQHGNPWLNSP